MSRVIKFRAWHPKHGMFSAEQMSEDQLTLDVNGRGLVNVHSGNPRLSEFYTHMVPMQFTGLYDRAGVPIYEGDIVELEDGTRNPYVIQWSNVLLAWAIASGEKDPIPSLLSMYEDGYTVIGNLHEHPELLEPAS